MVQVIIFPRGQLSKSDRARLTANGLVAVEADDPRAVVTAIPFASSVSSDDLWMSALEALVTSGYTEPRSEFVKALWRRVRPSGGGE